MRVLIIEDDTELADTLKEQLKNTYCVDCANCGEDGLYLANEYDYALIAIDMRLPDLNGQEVCKQLRSHSIKSPIIFITGVLDEDIVISSFEIGADDYLRKPFSMKEFHARIQALLRRPTNVVNTISVRDLTVNLSQRSVYKGDKLLKLRRKEYEILELLIRNRGVVFTRKQIIEQAWEDDTQGESNIVDVHIRNLRKVIDAPFKTQFIKTIHGVGYKLDG